MGLVSNGLNAWQLRFQYLSNVFYVLFISILDVVPIKALPESGMMIRRGYLQVNIVLRSGASFEMMMLSLAQR